MFKSKNMTSKSNSSDIFVIKKISLKINPEVSPDQLFKLVSLVYININIVKVLEFYLINIKITSLIQTDIYGADYKHRNTKNNILQK